MAASEINGRMPYAIRYRLSPRGRVLEGVRYHTSREEAAESTAEAIARESFGRGAVLSVTLAEDDPWVPESSET